MNIEEATPTCYTAGNSLSLVFYTDCISVIIIWTEKGDTAMGDTGKKDKGKREKQKKSQLTPKEKRRLKKENKNK